MNIVEAMMDPYLFGGHFAADSWAAWRTLLSGFYGLGLADDEVRLWRTIAGQRGTRLEPADELWLVIGRRGGKSQIAALVAVYEAVFNDHASKLAPGELATVALIAADRNQARTCMRYVSGLLNNNPMLQRLILREDKESVELTNRVVIEIKAASFRSVRGYTLACVIADEIAFWRSDESANPDTEILQALRPALATLGGKLIALSSPYARRGALWTTYRMHFGNSGRILVAQAPSMTMNPKLPAAVVEDAYNEDPSAASAEFGAQFRTDLEAFVSVEVLDSCTRPGPVQKLHDPRHRYTAFVDPSGGSSDAFTLAIAHREGNRVVVDMTRSTRPPFSPESVVEEYCSILREYRVVEVHGDRYAGEWPREQFRKRGITYRVSESAKSELYRDMLPLLNSDTVELNPNPQLRRELQGLERRTTRGGRDVIDHAPGAHDDLANAVAGAVVTAKRHRTAIAAPRMG